jgi:hypothetical protein
MSNQVLLIFLGSLLTFASTWIVENLKNGKERREKQENFKIFVRQELRAVIKNFEKLKTILEYKSYYDYIVLGQLDKSVLNLDNYKKEAIYLPSTNEQEKFIDLISDIASFVTDTRGIQNYYYDQAKPFNEPGEGQKKENPIFKTKKELDDYFESKRNEKAIDLVELKRRIEEFTREISA